MQYHNLPNPKSWLRLMLVAALLVLLPPVAAARDYVSVVGSSTVYPFAAVAAENFGRNSSFRTPRIESTGSGGGLKLFCAGVGPTHPDIANASRRIKRSEVKRCRGNGVTDIIEVKIGFDGIVFAHALAGAAFNLELRDIYLALAKQVPDTANPQNMKPNPYRTWNEVRADLPPQRIEVLGPPPTSGTRDAFVELAMEGGCKTFAHLKAMQSSDKNRYKALCHTLREDGAYIEAGENDNLIVRKLSNNPEALGIFGFGFLDQNRDIVKGVTIGGVAPEFEAIAEGAYLVSRDLYAYVKKQHIGSIPGIREFMLEYSREEASGEDGYLAERGLIPLVESERTMMRDRVRNLETLQASEL